MSPGLSVSLFGPMQVFLGDAPLPHLRSRKALALLALLILRQGRPAARGWLATTLWPDAELATALSSLRPVVSELRKALGPEGYRLQAGNRHWIAFEVDGLSIDALQFDQAIESRQFALAIEKYGGPLLEGWEEEWTFQERRVRHEAFLSALVRLGELAIDEGEHAKAISLFRRAVSADPFRDSPRHGMIRAYAASGDLNAALQEYREYAHRLGAEFGTSPQEETTLLYNRLRTEVRKSTKPLPTSEAAHSLPVGHVPTPLTALIGRDDERLDVSALLRRFRLVTLTGFGGIGKTRLALAVATDQSNHFPDGVWFVALDELSEGDLLARHVGNVLGLRELPNRSWLDGLKEHLREKTTLLVLDNCEHLQTPCAELVLRLLSECPRLKVLTTSRQALGIVGETSWIVPALAVPGPEQLPEGRATLQRVSISYEGVRLFAERAEAVASGFALTAENARTVSEICFRLEGIPLALELASSMVKARTVDQILQRLRDRLDLSSINRLAPSRQQTLRSTLEWSHELLSKDEQVLFRRLSVFLGGWTIEAATHLWTEDGSTERVIELTRSLIDRSLIAFNSEEGRYRWSEIVRQFAEEKLREAAEAESIRNRHLDWCVSLAEEGEPMLKGPQQRAWLQRLELEMPNLRAAADWASTNENEICAEAGLRLTGALSRFWYTRGEFREGRLRLSASLNRPGAELRTLARAKALYGLGILAYSQSEFVQARNFHFESYTIRNEQGDRSAAAESLINLGNIAHATSDHASATMNYRQALKLHTALNEKHGMALASSNLAAVKFALGQNREARSQLEKSIEMWREVGNQAYMAWDLSNLAYIAIERGDYLTAETFLDESWDIFLEQGNQIGLAWTLYRRAKIDSEKGRFDSAQELIERSTAIFDDLGDRNGLAWCLDEKSLISRRTGNYSKAQVETQEALELFRQIGDRHAVGSALQHQAILYRLEDRIDSALECISEASGYIHAAEEKRGLMTLLQELTMLTIMAGVLLEAVRAWATASKMSDEHELVMPSVDGELYEPLLKRAQIALGNDAFRVANKDGLELEPNLVLTTLLELVSTRLINSTRSSYAS